MCSYSSLLDSFSLFFRCRGRRTGGKGVITWLLLQYVAPCLIFLYPLIPTLPLAISHLPLHPPPQASPTLIFLLFRPLGHLSLGPVSLFHSLCLLCSVILRSRE